MASSSGHVSKTKRKAGRRKRWSVRIGLLLGLAALLAFSALWWHKGTMTDEMVLRRVSFSALDGWQADDVARALPAFLRSCDAWAALPPDTSIGGPPSVSLSAPYGTVGDWLPLCGAARSLPQGGGPQANEAARAFFERHFVPYTVYAGNRETGLFTGYYEIELHGSRTRSAAHKTPLLRRPDDLVHVELGLFRDHLRGERVAGRVIDGRLTPFESRGQIEGGALSHDDLALAFVDDPVDAFFLHIQGSGRVRLEDGSALRVGYDGQNGHPYTGIGRLLVERGDLTKEEASMQGIRRWLGENPDQADAVMNANASYIFFKELDIPDTDLGPLGAQGVPLTPLRSLAVDLKFHAMGVPVWLETAVPGASVLDPDGTVRQLMISQDTGGAIRGPVRGDFFWGFGERAGDIAGRMRHEGRYRLLLPRAVADRLGPETVLP